MTGPDQLTFHRPPRAYPAAVPGEPMRIAAPPTEQPPIHSSVVQVLMPLVGGVGLVGFAVVYKNTTFLYVAGAMMVLMLLASRPSSAGRWIARAARGATRTT
jgi:hypothetical protein